MTIIQLPLLQGFIKKDPISYREEFLLQKQHYQSQFELLLLKPSKEADEFVELLEFISHTIHHYKEDAEEFVEQLLNLLETQASILQPSVRLKVFQSLVLVRNKTHHDPLILLKLSFQLLGINDKVFRSTVTQFIFNDIKTFSQTKPNMNLQRAVQSFLHKFISDESSLIAQKSVHIISELYRKRIWTDAKTVNIIASAIYNSNNTVFIAAIHFFLGIDIKMLEDEEETEKSVKKQKFDINLHEHSKKTRKRERQVEKQRNKITKLQKKLSEKNNTDSIHTAKPLLPAIVMINNPNQLADHLYKKLKAGNKHAEKFENKLLIMNFLSQLIGCHKLILLHFYSFLQKYITAHQQNITQILVYLLQACHEFIPPEDLLPIIKNIAFHFITERSTDENITLGINTIREIISRIPSILLEEDMKDFIQDLTMYTHKHKKFVMSAARSLINLVREQHPTLLHKHDRGKGTNLAKKPLNFGQQDVLDSRDLLKMDGEEDSEDDEDDEGDWEEEGEEEINEDEDDEFEEVEEDDDEEEGDGGDDDSGEWVDVDEDAEEIEIEDGDEEGKGDENSDEDDGEEEDDDDEELEEIEEDEEGDDDDVDEEEDDDEEAPELVEMKDEEPKKSKKSKKSKGIRHRLDVNRILNDEDLKLFEHLKAFRQQKRRRDTHEEGDDDEGRDNESDEEGSDKEDDDDDDEEERFQPDYVVDPSNLLPSTSVRLSKIERIHKVLSGRNETKYVKEAHAGGLTNKEKLRKKNFMMVRKGKRELLQKSRRGSGDVRAAKAQQKEIWGRDKRKKRRI